uniref:Uncharacterized protein n=1 Tax=Cacopsylla melanoneura TaxID=428564 RepID=A0A8D9DT20_9HEMI
MMILCHMGKTNQGEMRVQKTKIGTGPKRMMKKIQIRKITVPVKDKQMIIRVHPRRNINLKLKHLMIKIVLKMKRTNSKITRENMDYYYQVITKHLPNQITRILK